MLPAEEQNTTETTKAYKVNCDKKNITGMDNFAVQVLNTSQVFFWSWYGQFFVPAVGAENRFDRAVYFIKHIIIMIFLFLV